MKHYTNNTTGLLLGTLTALIAVDTALFNSSGYGVIGAMIAVLLVGLSAVVKLESAFYIVLFCFPFSSLLKLSYSSISILPILYIVVIVRLLLSERIKLRLNQWLFFFIFLLLQIIGISAYGASFIDLISFFVSLLFVLCSASFFSNYETKDNRLFKTSTVFFTVAVMENVLLSDLFPNMLYTISPDKQEALVQNKRFGAMFVEPNEFAQVVLITIGLLITLLPMIRGFARVLDIGAIVFLGISGYRTYSKSYVLTLFLLLIVLAFVYLRFTVNKKGAKAVLPKILPVLAIAFVGCVWLYYYVIAPTFEQRGPGDFLTGRGEIWLSYMEAFFSRLDIVLWGSGVGNVTYLNQVNVLIGSRVPHNMYLEFVIQFGIVGLLVLWLMVARLAKQMKSKRYSFFILVLLAFLITSFGISVNANDCIFMVALFTTMPFESFAADTARQKADVTAPY